MKFATEKYNEVMDHLEELFQDMKYKQPHERAHLTNLYNWYVDQLEDSVIPPYMESDAIPD
jgi:hypothetical protein